MYYGVDENGLHEVKCVGSLTAEAAVQGAMYDAHELCEGALHGEDRMNKKPVITLNDFQQHGKGLSFKHEVPIHNKIQFLDLSLDIQEDHVCWGFSPTTFKRVSCSMIQPTQS